MFLDKKKIAEMADPETVAEFIGIPSQKKGSRISILCPDHIDTHFGSCYLTDRGYHCFSCGASGDVFQMVRSFKGKSCSFQEAMETVANASGGVDLFLMSDDDKAEQKRTLKEMENLPTKEELQFIGLKGYAGALYDTDYVESIGKPELKPGQKAVEITDDNGSTGLWKVLTVIDRTPLLTLYKEEPDEFWEMIQAKACETIQNFIYIKETYWSFIKEKMEECGAKDVTKQEVDSALDGLIRQAEEIAIKYGGGYSPPPTNRFGNLRRRG